MRRPAPGAVLVLLAGCQPAATTPTAQYVGRATCAACHAAAERAYAGSDHDRSMAEAADSAVLGDFSGVTLALGRDTAVFFRRDGGFWVRTRGSGEAAEYRVAYTFGVSPLQQYLVAFPGGRLQRLPLSWDSRPAGAGGQRWLRVPEGEPVTPDDPLHWTRLGGRWNALCADCHSTGVRRNYDAASGTYATEWAAIDVTCEACHGPGSRHVAWSRLEPDRRVADQSRGLPAPVAREAQRQVCARCHSSRTVIRQDEPGTEFDDTHTLTLLDTDRYHADGQAKEEVFVWGSFLQSRMYRAGVGCADCHDPHSTRVRAGGDAVCTGCHAATQYAVPQHHHHPTASAGARCVECHMPARTYMAVDRRRDHAFRVPRPDVAAAVGAPDACTGCHETSTQTWAARQIERWTDGRTRARAHFALTLHPARRGDPAARAPLIALSADPTAAPIVRATAVTLLPHYGAPAAEAMRRALRDSSPLVRAAAVGALERLGSPDPLDLLPLVDDQVRSVRIVAARALAPAAALLAAASRARQESALQEWLAAQALNADLPSAQLNLGGLYAAQGDGRAAETAFRRAIAIEPGLGAPYLALAHLHDSAGRPVEARRVLRQGLARAPRDPALHHAWALLVARRGQRDSAVAHLAEAARLAPDEPGYAFAHALALHENGRTGESLEVLRSTLERFPWDGPTLLALATILRDRGNPAAASAYAERLAQVGLPP